MTCPVCNGDGGELRESSMSAAADGLTFFHCSWCEGAGRIDDDETYQASWYFAPDAPSAWELWG